MRPNLSLIAGTALSPMSLSAAIDHYLDRRGARGLRPNSLLAYANDLRQLLDCLTRRHAGPPLVAVIAPRDISGWLDELQAGGVSPRSQARKLATVRGFFRHAQRERWTGIDPTEGESIKWRAKRVVAPELPALLAMVDAIPADRLGVRDRAILRLALDAGLRIGSVVSLDAPGFGSEAEVDMQAQLVHAVGKGGQTDTTPINARTVRLLQDWLRVRPYMAAPDEPALFVSTRGGRMGRQGLHEMFKRRAAAAGLPDIHWHLLRHRRVRGICEVLGTKVGQQFAHHASEATTSHYGTHADGVAQALIRERGDLDALAREQGRASA